MTKAGASERALLGFQPSFDYRLPVHFGCWKMKIQSRLRTPNILVLIALRYEQKPFEEWSRLRSVEDEIRELTVMLDQESTSLPTGSNKTDRLSDSLHSKNSV